ADPLRRHGQRRRRRVAERPHRRARPAARLEGRRVSRLAELGVRPLINAAGTYTILGGSRLAPPVAAAMAEAADTFLDFDLLSARVGERIAKLTQNEAALVTSGAAAGVAIAIAAC